MKRHCLLSVMLAAILLAGITQTAKAQSAAERCEKESGDSAIAACNEAIRQNPRSAVLFNSRGKSWNMKGDHDKAIADLNEAIRLDPKYPGAYNNRGISWGIKGNYEKAFGDFNEAIRLSPDYVSAYINRGLASRNKGDYDKAIADFDQAIRLDPKHANAYNNRGAAWKKKGDYDKAVSDYNEAIKLNPNHDLAKNNLKSALEEKSKLQSAVAKTQAQQQQASVQPAPQQTPIATAPIGKRVALIIGNAKYHYSPALENPTRDAQLLASTLRGVGFQSASVKTDLTREGMMQALREFAQTADNAEWAVVYYSGHGIEFGGANYMIPVDAQLRVDRDIDLETVNVGQVMNTIEGATRLRLVVLDACRDNPFASQMRRTMATRSIGKGLARIEPEAGTLVVYAAKHGETAMDGDGKNSPFAEALVKRMQQRPPLEIRRLFDFVRDDVLESTRKKQQPFSYGSLSAREDFYFVK